MKKIKKLFIRSVLGLAVISCNNDDDHTTNLNRLRPVSFQIPPEEAVSSQYTGKIVMDSNRIPRKEYEVTVRRSTAFTEADLMEEAPIKDSILYPGSLLKGESFMNGIYEPVKLSNTFNPVTLCFTKYYSSLIIKKEVVPKEKEVLRALSDFKEDNSYFSSAKYISVNNMHKSDKNFSRDYVYKSVKVTTEESFKKAINLHVKAKLASIAKTSFGYEYSNPKVKSSNYVMVKVKRTAYSVSVDTVNFANWVQGGIRSSESGPYEPVYISSIDYGRAAYLLIETSKSVEETEKMVKSAMDFKLNGGATGLNYMQHVELEKLFDSRKVKVSVVNDFNHVVSYDQFMNYMNFIDRVSAIAVSYPISYTIRRLKDNTQVAMVNVYEEVHKEYR